MVNLVRNKRKFYLCKKIANSTKFEKPIPKNLNYQPVNSVGEMLTLGEEYSMYLKIKCSPAQAADFSDKDRCYIYKQPEVEHNEMCDDADYVVDGEPIITLNEAEITLRKLSGGQY